MSRKSLDQERAAYAWKCVQSVKDKQKDYKNLAKSLPALVMSNGLIQTLAFLKAKEKQEHHLTLGAHIVAWAMTSNKPE
jgi:CRISPR-associated protein Cmr5